MQKRPNILSFAFILLVVLSITSVINHRAVASPVNILQLRHEPLNDRPITSPADASTNGLPFHPHEDSPFEPPPSGTRDGQHGQQDADLDAPALEPRSLVKRGGCFSRQVGDSEEFECDGQMPDIATLRQKIRDYGQIPSHRSVFYTNLGSAGGMATARRWICAHPQEIAPVNGGPGYAMFDNIVDERWLTAQAVALRTQGNIDAFQKLLSQAFAEVSAGRAYIFMPSDQEAQAGSTWMGWELPALQRNTAVTDIFRVDPRSDTGTNGDVSWRDTGHVIWKKGDAITTPDPLGLNVPGWTFTSPP